MTTEERLAKVERELVATKRRSRWLLAVLGVGLGVLALVWASAASVPKAEAQGAAGGRTVRANEFFLVDENGKLRAGLTVTAAGPALCLYDAAGKGRVGLAVVGGRGVLADGPSLVLHDENGEIRAMLRVGAAGPALVLCNEAGKPIWSAP